MQQTPETEKKRTYRFRGKNLPFRKKNLPFRTILAISFIGITSVLMLIMGVVLSAVSGNYIQKEYQETHNSYMELFSYTMDSEINDLTDEMRGLLGNTTFMSILAEGNSSSAYFTSKQQRSLESQMLSLLDDNSYIKGVLAVSSQGNFRYRQRSGTTLSTLSEFYRDWDILEEDWIAEADANQGKEQVYGWNLLDPTDQTSFTITKRMINPKTKEPVGYMAILVSKNMLINIFGHHNAVLDNNCFLIIDTGLDPSDDHYLVCSDNIEETQMDEILQAYSSGKQSRYVFGEYRSDAASWEVITVISRKSLSHQSDYVRLVVIVCFLVMLLLLIPLAGLLSNRLLRPLDKLEKTISEVGNGNYHPEVEFDDDEIGKVGKYLLTISENNLELREKLLHSEISERESQLQLLQSQINPHFLYNTLDALYFMAIIDEADDIAEMVKALSDMFRLSLNHGSETIRISEELQKITAYMKIQNMRYQNRFHLEIDVDEDIMNERILTFLLQPIVENAVTHGLENKIGEGTVTIMGYRDGEDLHLTIHDDGVGIDDLSKLEQGYGIKNVRERIRLYYGDDYEVSFESIPQEGTTVFFRFPPMNHRKEKNA